MSWIDQTRQIILTRLCKRYQAQASKGTRNLSHQWKASLLDLSRRQNYLSHEPWAVKEALWYVIRTVLEEAFQLSLALAWNEALKGHSPGQSMVLQIFMHFGKSAIVKHPQNWTWVALYVRLRRGISERASPRPETLFSFTISRPPNEWRFRYPALVVCPSSLPALNVSPLGWPRKMQENIKV